MATNENSPSVTWRKSSRSTNGGNCVEVAREDSRYLVRDSKDPDGFILSFAPSGWAAFLGWVKAGNFDTRP
ncbi:DUF397 domain-containing protein [Streptosporangium sp. CA-115845]|uniref:DUF397 domain-containing protein n=1 Tax=Streptosporangium sp. CA-115845 TaxID=3240071 RepID=UPI003D8D5044